MIPDAEDLYPAIGQALVAALPQDFATAWIRVEMLDDVWSVGVFFRPPEGALRFVSDDLDTIEDLFVTLRQRYRDGSQATWSTATFTLQADGRMKLDLGYEDVSDFGQAAVRRTAWMEKYLGGDAVIDWG
jgi:hypothetical protein